VLTVLLAVPLASTYPPTSGEIPGALLYLCLIMLAQAMVLHFEVRRHSLSVTVGEIPAAAGAVLPVAGDSHRHPPAGGRRRAAVANGFR
jgi:hypothetical protein